MACDLTTDLSAGCKNSIGGVKAIYVAQLEHKNTLSDTAGVIDTFTLTTGNQFWTYATIKETSSFTDTLTGSEENGSLFAAQSVTAIFNKGQVATRNELVLLSSNRVMVIVLDGNGTYWLLGEGDGLTVETAEFASGTAKADRNGYTVTMVGNEDTAAKEVDSTLIATLTAPAA